MIKFLLNLLARSLSFLGMPAEKSYRIAEKPKTSKCPEITSETNSFQANILKSFFSQNITINIWLGTLNSLKIHNGYLGSHLAAHKLPPDF